MTIIETPALKTEPATVSYAMPNAGHLLALGEENLEMSRELVITSNEEAALYADELGKVKGLIKTLNESRLSITRPLDAAKKAVMALFDPALGKLGHAEQNYKVAIGAWQEKERRRIADEQAKAEAAARAERERLEREAAAARAAAEEQERIAREERERAEALLKEGKIGEAGALMNSAESRSEQAVQAQETAAVREETAALIVAPPVSTQAATKIAGVGSRKKKVAKVIDVVALGRHVFTERTDLVEIFELDQGKLNRLANALGEHLKLPGVEVKDEIIVTSRAR